MVKEPWTTLGIAQELTQTWNGVTLLTTGLFMLFGLVWLVVRLTFEKNTLLAENNVLYMLGWRSSKINLRNSLEQYTLISFAFVISCIILYLLDASTRMYGIIGGLWIFAIVVSMFLLNKKEKTKIRTEQYKHFAAIFYHKRLIFPSMLILLLSTILISVQLATLGSSYQDSSFTTMGEFTNDLTFWIQLSIMVSTFVLAVISITECVNTLLLERKSEFHMYHVIGWRKTRILFHLLKETMIWTIVSLVIGAIVGTIVLVMLHVPFIWILLGLGISVGLSIIAVTMIILTRRLSGNSG